MMRFQLEDLHAVALNAFDEMEAVAVRAESDTTEFNERQFVFQLGALLTRGAITQGGPLWTAFEYKYPGTQNARDKTRCDLVVWERNSENVGTMGWLEVKSTGLDENGNWDNAFGKLGWENDFDKLAGIAEKVWEFQHKGAWIWLYQFETYRRQVDSTFGIGTQWSAPTPPSAFPNAFGTAHEGRVNLQRILAEIESASTSILMSVRPSVRTHYQDKRFSALVVTATVGAGSKLIPSEEAVTQPSDVGISS